MLGFATACLALCGDTYWWVIVNNAKEMVGKLRETMKHFGFSSEKINKNLWNVINLVPVKSIMSDEQIKRTQFSANIRLHYTHALIRISLHFCGLLWRPSELTPLPTMASSPPSGVIATARQAIRRMKGLCGAIIASRESNSATVIATHIYEQHSAWIRAAANKLVLSRNLVVGRCPRRHISPFVDIKREQPL